MIRQKEEERIRPWNNINMGTVLHRSVPLLRVTIQQIVIISVLVIDFFFAFALHYLRLN